MRGADRDPRPAAFGIDVSACNGFTHGQAPPVREHLDNHHTWLICYVCKLARAQHRIFVQVTDDTRHECDQVGTLSYLSTGRVCELDAQKLGLVLHQRPGVRGCDRIAKEASTSGPKSPL